LRSIALCGSRQVSGLSATFRSQRLQTVLGFGGVGLGLVFGIAGEVLVSNAPEAPDTRTGLTVPSFAIVMTVLAGMSALVRTLYERAADDSLREAANEDSEAVERRFAALLANDRSEWRVLRIRNAVRLPARPVPSALRPQPRRGKAFAVLAPAALPRPSSLSSFLTRYPSKGLAPGAAALRRDRRRSVSASGRCRGRRPCRQLGVLKR
jgi:hypothetical protein